MYWGCKGESDFYQYSGETNLTSIRILNNGQEDGWENLSLSFDNSIENVTISIAVDFINISSESQVVNETSDNFSKYVFYDLETNITFLNLSSGDSANLTLTITTLPWMSIKYLHDETSIITLFYRTIQTPYLLLKSWWYIELKNLPGTNFIRPKENTTFVKLSLGFLLYNCTKTRMQRIALSRQP